MKFSRHNIFSQIHESENWFIVNLLSGSADLLNPQEAAIIEKSKDSMPDITDPFQKELMDKGYFTDEQIEKKHYRERYLKFIDDQASDEVQLFFVPNYSCNFSCTYCYQEGYSNPQDQLTIEIIDSFYVYVKTEFASRKKYITLFGGEPLLAGEKQKKLVKYFLEKASENNLEVCIVTNGYTLTEYMEVLSNAKIREIQITLDGVNAVHNKRRPLKDGSSTFDRVSRGIDACLEYNIPLNLRMVIDKENISGLAELSKYAIEKGWTQMPGFKTQLGRNYELHYCQGSPEKLFDRLGLYQELYSLIKQHPYIREFYKPSYSVSKFLSENGTLPDPLFDSCPGCKTEWAFDYTGRIYSCTATVGKLDEQLGTFYPSKTSKSEAVIEWQNRDITGIPECKDCNLQLACGGGCAAVAKNASGIISSPNCRPVKELLELGFASYLENN